EDRPDIVTRVFKMKLDSLMKDLKDRRMFGHVKGAVYTIEFQKRGLPHCHILLWLETKDKITTTTKIDKYISAEIPNKDEDPDLRRNDGNTIKKSGSDLHNGYVVPYNPALLRKYQAHINVEYCNQVGSIKYLFKYINKGPDRVTAAVEGEEVDEIKDYYDCRYLSACEAAWRVFGFEIHYRTPCVERLPFHLQDEQSVLFDATDSIDFTLEKESVNETKFIQWMELNKLDTFARTLRKKNWTRRQRGFSLGRIHHVPPSWGELFYLRVLLNKVIGPEEWSDLRKYDDV
ncbi:ATP-dependent DNA helicase PIF1-like protein, partial [Tanacetum coccineum]